MGFRVESSSRDVHLGQGIVEIQGHSQGRLSRKSSTRRQHLASCDMCGRVSSYNLPVPWGFRLHTAVGPRCVLQMGRRSRVPTLAWDL